MAQPPFEHVAEKSMPIAEHGPPISGIADRANGISLRRFHAVCEAQENRRGDHLIREVHVSQRADFNLAYRTPIVAGAAPLLCLRGWNHSQRQRLPSVVRIETPANLTDELGNSKGLPVEFQGVRIPVVRPDIGGRLFPRLKEYGLVAQILPDRTKVFFHWITDPL